MWTFVITWSDENGEVEPTLDGLSMEELKYHMAHPPEWAVAADIASLWKGTVTRLWRLFPYDGKWISEIEARGLEIKARALMRAQEKEDTSHE